MSKFVPHSFLVLKLLRNAINQTLGQEGGRHLQRGEACLSKTDFGRTPSGWLTSVNRGRDGMFKQEAAADLARDRGRQEVGQRQLQFSQRHHGLTTGSSRFINGKR
jgi:hypothetical protein